MEARPTLHIRLKKVRDAPAVSAREHSGGSVAVETLLAIREGFYGRVASGSDITGFGSRWPRGPLPAEAIVVPFWRDRRTLRDPMPGGMRAALAGIASSRPGGAEEAG